MIILIKRTLTDFAEKHPQASTSVNNWYALTKNANWGKLSDIKSDFNNVDYVGNDRYVFNIKGNDFRLVTMIFFNKRTVYIRFVGTHQEYDKIDCLTI